MVDITGATRITNSAGNEQWYAGGLLAQPTNSGQHAQDSFAVVPELDLNLGFQFTTHTRLVVGYSGLYWSKVARAGEQIDRSVDPTYLPGNNGGTPPAGTHPQFTFQETGFWAQGINVGVDCRW